MREATSEERVEGSMVVAERAPLDGERSALLGPCRTSHDPATGRLLGKVPLLGREGIDAAVRTAREAQPGWASRSIRQRARTLLRFRDALVLDSEAVARLISMEQGKPQVEAMSMEILSVLAHLKWLIEEGARGLEERRTPLFHPLFAMKRARYRYEPLGVVAIISPWNYPFAIPTIQLLAALLAGNAVIFKPSPYTPLVGQKIAELARQAGVPSGVLQVIHIEDEDGSALTSHPGLNKIFFTGSVETGRRVMASAALVPTPVILELGGKDATIVAADADLARAVPAIAWYALSNSGQSCAAVERVYVHEQLYDRFVAELTRLVEGLRVGEGARQEVEIGPLANERQLQLVEAHVTDARAKGARVLTGGHRLSQPGYFYAPTVLVDVTREMRLMREESFGPLIPVVRVGSLEEAIEAANGSPYALSASIWTQNERLGLEVARRLRAGSVNINDHAFHYAEPGASWGGLDTSGFGRSHGMAGLREMVNEKFISVDMRRGGQEAWWYPYDETFSHFLRNAIRVLYGPVERRSWAILSLLLNPRTWRRVDLFNLVRGIRRWW